MMVMETGPGACRARLGKGMPAVDEREYEERKLEAAGLEELEESGMEKIGEISIDADEELVLVGDRGPVPYGDLLTKDEYLEFKELAENQAPTDEEVARGHALLRLMMKRYPDGPTPK